MLASGHARHYFALPHRLTQNFKYSQKPIKILAQSLTFSFESNINELFQHWLHSVDSFRPFWLIIKHSQYLSEYF